MISQRFKILMVTLITGVLVIAYQAAEFFNGWGFDPISFVIASIVSVIGLVGVSSMWRRESRRSWRAAVRRKFRQEKTN